MRKFILLFFALFVLYGCKEDKLTPPQPSLLTDQEMNAFEIKKSTQEEESEDNTSQSWSTSPYSVKVYFLACDTPCYRIYEEIWHDRFISTFKSQMKDCFLIDFVNDVEKNQQLLYTKNVTNLGKKFLQQLDPYDIVLALTYSVEEKQVQLRSLQVKTRQLSPYTTIDFKDENYNAVFEQWINCIGLEGKIDSIDDDNLTMIHFRGDVSSYIHPGDYFEIYSNNRRLAGTLIRLDEIIQKDNILQAKGTCLGLYSPSENSIIRKAYFVNGTQVFQIVDELQNSQMGYSVFVSKEKFTTDISAFLMTTDIDGKFTVTIKDKSPLYIVVAKNIDGVLIPFSRHMCNIKSEQDTIEKIEILSWNIKAENLSDKKQIQKFQNQIVYIKEQAQQYLERKESEKALICIELIKKRLKLLNQDSMVKIRNVIENLEQAWKNAIQERHQNEKYIFACAQVDKADNAVDNMEYKNAAFYLQNALKNWPENIEKEQRKALLQRIKSIERLQKEETEDIGKVRQYLSKTLPKKTPGSIDMNYLDNTLRPALEILSKRAVFDEIYNDEELCNQCKITLNNFSTYFANQEKEYKEKFKQANTAKEREECYQKIQQPQMYRSFLDDCISIF